MSETELKFAKKAIAQIAQMGGEHTRLLLEYIKLFSCKEAPLTLAQTFDILVEVDEFWKTYPTDVWQKAVGKLLVQQRSGSLKTPLPNHDLLIDEMELLADFDDSDTPPQIKSPDPPKKYTPPTERQKAQAAHHIQNMMSAINQPKPFNLRKKHG